MGKTALLFPGQGSQAEGMGAQFHEAWPEFRAAFERCDGAVADDLHELVFEGSSDRLRETRYTQPAVLAVGAAASEALAERFGLEPDLVAGHSLGHFTAHVASGGLDVESAVELVAERGRLMQEAGKANGPGTMMAVLFVDPETVASVCADHDGVSVGVYNGPRQTVVSGERDAVERVVETLEADHGGRFRELDVGAAFHSPVMETAVEAFARRLDRTPFEDASIPVVSDVSGEPYRAASVAREQLTEQLTSPVDWTAVVRTLDAAGVTEYVELPPAGTLGSLVEGMGVDGTVHELTDPADAKEFVQHVRQR